MSLKRGKYLIFDERGNLISRLLYEDKSFAGPKVPIVKHVRPIPPDPATWTVEPLIGGKPNTYVLSNRDAATDESNGLVWANGDSILPPPSWIIFPLPGKHNRYYITREDDSERPGGSWVVPEGDEQAQIKFFSPSVRPSEFQFVHILD
ncbi:hypothetical protein E1B28_012881 [Marasmius oreades]|uniref:Uncharacterized protein n=1 Tax=Marasmius oreades TaxID=181124 RepID=A0A9P7UQE5_9AGAR|nr:uncharacterized protein E1B28_012881 [Marasmius oreades]KAG7088936.1 hypothetical protein E1B28_012881 [Marasmius oreades]